MRGGYIPGKDYYYFCDCIVTESEEYFEDTHGNRIFGYYGGLTFSFLGWNSTIEIGSNAYIKNTCVFLHNQSVLRIGADTEFIECFFSLWDKALVKIDKSSSVKKARYEVEDNSIVDIGEKCRFSINGGVVLRKNSSLIIGARTSIGKNYTIGIGTNTNCIIGEDCMFSYDICLRTNDGHSIFDVESRTIMNHMKKQEIEVKIGNHVWIGMRVTIMYNTDIGEGSIVGACSFVKCKAPNNVLLFGTPAQVTRRNVAWSRSNQIEDILSCGEENIKFTKNGNCG